MNPAAAEVAFLGHLFLNSNAGELCAIANQLNLPDWERRVTEDAPGLELEYNRLFLNPLGSPCALWQSAHTDGDRLMGEPHLSALAWFRRYDVEPAATNDPADHVGLLLLFYAHLLEIDAPAEAIDRFRSEHLEWIAGFCDSVRHETRLSLYDAACSRLQDLLASAPAPVLPVNRQA